MASILNLPPRTNAGLPRVDGPLKVSGVAMYTSDHNLPGMLYAVPVCATIANGTIASHRHQPRPGDARSQGRLHPPEPRQALQNRASPDGFTGYLDERRPPFEDDTIRYYGQYVAAVVALPSSRPSPQPMPSR